MMDKRTLTVTDERRSGLGYAIRNRAGVAIAHVHTESPELVAVLAAAPDLLAACEAMVAHYNATNDGKDWTEFVPALRAAIAKARGAS